MPDNLGLGRGEPGVAMASGGLAGGGGGGGPRQAALRVVPRFFPTDSAKSYRSARFRKRKSY